MFGSRETNRDGPKIKAIQSILTGLGQLSVAERMTQLGNVVATLQGVTTDGRKRLQLLESCRDPILAVAEDVQQSCIVQSLPISKSEFKRVRIALKLVGDLAQHYSQISRSSVKNRKITRLGFHRELELREVYLVLSALAYIPLPDGFWAQVHSAIHAADKEGAADFKPNGADNRLSLSTGQLYVAIVLIGQADPYQLGFREVLRVREVATLLANRVNVIADRFHVNPDARRYVFLVDKTLNQPAMPWGTGREGRLPEGSMVLDVTDVVKRVRRTHKSLQPDDIAFDATFPDEPKRVIVSFYEHLILQWGKQPIRRVDRSIKVSSYQLCVGISDNVKMPAVLTSDGRLPGSDEIILSGGLESDESPTSMFLSARSQDTSFDGIRFIVTGHTSKRIAAGEVVSYNLEGDGAWSTGIIRWVRGESAGNAEFGVMVLGEFESIVDIVAPDAGAQDDETHRAIIVRDNRKREKNCWIVRAQSESDEVDAGALQVRVGDEFRSAVPLNRVRYTPFVTYQYVSIADALVRPVAAQNR